MTRSEAKQGLLSVPVVADALDRDQVAEVVARANPDVIVHQLTAIPDTLDMRHFERAFAPTNRLRTVGTDNLLSAGEAVAWGVRGAEPHRRLRAHGRPRQTRKRPVRPRARPRDAPEPGGDPSP